MNNLELVKVIHLVFTIQTFCVKPSNSQYTVYSNINWEGNHQDIDISKCNNFVSELAKKVSSVKSTATCVRLHTEENCSGNYIDLLPYAIHKNNLIRWGFDDLAVSAGPCGDPCDVTVTGSLPPENGINLTIFERPFYRGAMARLNVKGCTLIPRKMENTIRTINVTSPGGNCLELYNNVYCKTTGQTWTGGPYESIELRQGSPFMDSLKPWFQTFDYVGAISHCSYKCNKNNQSQVTHVSQEPSTDNPVVLYDDFNFTGNSLAIRSPGYNKCVRLDQYEDWEGKVMSVKLYEKKVTCVVLYDELDCTGKWEIALFRSDGEVGTEKYCSTDGKTLFCPGVRSLLFCNPKRNKFKRVY